MAIQKGGGGDDEGDSYTKQADAKSSAQLAQYSKAKLAWDKAKPSARAEADQNAAQSKRPAKDIPIDEPSTGLMRMLGADESSLLKVNKEDDGDEGEDGEGGKSGKGGSGGGQSPDLDIDASDYTPFADAVDTKANKAEQRAESNRQKAEQKAQESEGPKKGTENAVKAVGPVANKGGPAAPSASGKTGGGSGPSGGAKGGGGPGPSAGPG